MTSVGMRPRSPRRRRLELDVAGEGGAAEADDAGIAQQVAQDRRASCRRVVHRHASRSSDPRRRLDHHAQCRAGRTGAAACAIRSRRTVPEVGAWMAAEKLPSGGADALPLEHFLPASPATAACRRRCWRSGTTSRDGSGARAIGACVDSSLCEAGLTPPLELEECGEHSGVLHDFQLYSPGTSTSRSRRVSGIGTMAMQSTGQGGTHSSQPVHCGATMVCICFAAPTMASTGQAWMHSVQPMQSVLVDEATLFGFSTPCSPESGLNSAPEQVGQLADAFLAAGRALVDVGLALGDGLRHRACSRGSRTGRTASAAGWRRSSRPADRPSTLNRIAAIAEHRAEHHGAQAMTRIAVSIISGTCPARRSP